MCRAPEGYPAGSLVAGEAVWRLLDLATLRPRIAGGDPGPSMPTAACTLRALRAR